MRRATQIASMVALASLATARADANPVDAFGIGARGTAMGGAQTAASRDTSANYYNPALLASFVDMQISVGYRLAAPSLAIGGLDLDVDTSRGTHIGLAVPGQLGPVHIAIGTSTFLPDQHLSRVRSLPPTQPRFSLYDNRPQRLFLAANVAVRVGRRFFFGAGISYMSNTDGGVVLGGRLGFPNANDSELDLDIDVDLKTIRYPQAGVAFDVNDWLRLGASYRGEFNLVSDLTVRLEGDIGPEGSPVVEDGFLDLRSVTQDLYQPAQLSLGAAIDAGGGWRVALDLALHRWSRLNNPAAQIQIELDLGEFNDLVDIPEPADAPDPRFHDIAIPRVGVEGPLYRGDCNSITARLGYSYEPTVAPEQTGSTNFVDNDKHTFALGAGWDISHLGDIIGKPVSIDAFAALTWLPTRMHRKLSPIDPVGDYRSSGTVAQIGVSTRWRF